MARETKVGLIVGLGVILFVSVFVSDYLSDPARDEAIASQPLPDFDRTTNQMPMPEPVDADLTPGAIDPGQMAAVVLEQAERRGRNHHHCSRRTSGPRQSGQRVDQLSHGRAGRQRVPRHEDQAHLHAEGQEAPHAAVGAPRGRGLADRIVCKDDRRENHDSGQQHRDHERIGRGGAEDGADSEAEPGEHRGRITAALRSGSRR